LTEAGKTGKSPRRLD